MVLALSRDCPSFQSNPVDYGKFLTTMMFRSSSNFWFEVFVLVTYVTCARMLSAARQMVVQQSDALSIAANQHERSEEVCLMLLNISIPTAMKASF